MNCCTSEQLRFAKKEAVARRKVQAENQAFPEWREEYFWPKNSN